MRRRIGSALAVGLVFYALSDILIWQRIFETNGIHQYDGRYQTGHHAVLVGMIAISVVLLYEARFWAIWFALAFYTLAYSGLEDVRRGAYPAPGEALAFQADDIDLKGGRVLVDGPVGSNRAAGDRDVPTTEPSASEAPGSPSLTQAKPLAPRRILPAG